MARPQKVKKEKAIRFAAAVSGMPAANSDPRVELIAVCVLHQQNAGFKEYIDLREANCPDCNGSGFNTGWGYWLFMCGAEIMTDGTPSEPCGKEKK